MLILQSLLSELKDEFTPSRKNEGPERLVSSYPARDYPARPKMCS